MSHFDWCYVGTKTKKIYGNFLKLLQCIWEYRQLQITVLKIKHRICPKNGKIHCRSRDRIVFLLLFIPK